jgi:hypothetical protein
MIWLRRAREVVGADQVEVLERRLREPRGRQHAVHEVDREARTSQDLFRLTEVEEVALAPLREVLVRLPRGSRDPDDVEALRELCTQRMPDEAAASADDHDRSPGRWRDHALDHGRSIGSRARRG